MDEADPEGVQGSEHFAWQFALLTVALVELATFISFSPFTVVNSPGFTLQPGVTGDGVIV